MKIVMIVGARPQFIKLAPLLKEVKKRNLEAVVLHTGQHYDISMSEVFFDELGISKPKYNLGINQMSRNEMIPKMTKGIQELLEKEVPDWVVVFGDTNSTLAGGIAGKEINIPVAHIEAGLRSCNLSMPEEVNRIETDKLSDLLFVPTIKAIENLKVEGLFSNERVILSGDIMLDAFKVYSPLALLEKDTIKNLPPKFILGSLHRDALLENREHLAEVIESLNEINEEIPIVFAAHPRTFSVFRNMAIPITFRIVEAQSYFSMLRLLNQCSIVITDSGGLQKEAFYAKKPCIIVREETEWEELIAVRVSLLAGFNHKKILEAFTFVRNKNFDFGKKLFGNGDAASIIVETLLTYRRY